MSKLITLLFLVGMISSSYAQKSIFADSLSKKSPFIPFSAEIESFNFYTPDELNAYNDGEGNLDTESYVDSKSFLRVTPNGSFEWITNEQTIKGRVIVTTFNTSKDSRVYFLVSQGYVGTLVVCYTCNLITLSLPEAVCILTVSKFKAR